MNRRIVIASAAVLVFVLTGVVTRVLHIVSSKHNELVIFYEVPMVCGEAPDIGCGSRSKPVLIELKNLEKVKEAWLNRAGTMIAVVGGSTITDERELAASVEPIFRRNDLPAAYVEQKDQRDGLMADFRTAGKWYEGSDVDKLSMEEAGRIAERVAGDAAKAGLINEKEAAAIKSDVEAYFKKALLNIRTCSESDSTGARCQADVYDIFREHIGKERAGKVRKMYEESRSSETEKD
ncbi:MAG TPA: hypothetical protein VES59_08590 [Bacteroidota bacterium]|nr:hypothetical protein [Bacteroidota bacterium]